MMTMTPRSELRDRVLAEGVMESIHHMTPGGVSRRRSRGVFGWAALILACLFVLAIAGART